MNEQQVWAAVDERRAALSELLAGLSADQWKAQTLCDGWTVRDLAGHLTMSGMSPRQVIGLALRHPGGTNRIIRNASIALGQKSTPEDLVHKVRATVGVHRTMIGLTCREALIDVICHTYDVAIPLALPIEVPAAQAAEAADRVVSYRGRGSAKVFRQLPMNGFVLRANDYHWSTGSGLEVTGAMVDLFLLLTGRPARVGVLEGPGAERLTQVLAFAEGAR